MKEDSLKIIVCDDEKEPRGDWVEAIQALDANFEVSQIGKDEVDELRILVDRRYDLRDGKDVDWSPMRIDGADILVVDYDLTLIEKGARHTGEQVARLARLYSNCGYVIVMNQYPGVGFDLTLKGHLESYADLNIDAKLLGTPSLWSKPADGGFAPWYWDDIPKLTDSRRALAAQLSKDKAFDIPIVEILQMPPTVINNLGDTAFAFIDPSSEGLADFSEATIRKFLMNLSEHKDADKLLSKMPEFAARTAVSRIGKWLSRVLLGSQDILIDVPHLLARMPFLVNPAHKVPSDTAGWNTLLELGTNAIHDDVVAGCAFGRAMDWIGKPAFWWPEIESMPLVDELRDAFDYETFPDITFAEDTSRFIAFDEATEFRAGFHNIYDRRYVERPDSNIVYAPRRRLTFASYE